MALKPPQFEQLMAKGQTAMRTGAAQLEQSGSPLELAIRDLKRVFVNLGVLSFFINLLVLASPLYMLQVYDRVLTSKSGATLFFLTLYIVLALATMGALEFVRSRILVRVGIYVDQRLAPTIFNMVLSEGATAQPLRDLESLRALVSGNSILAILDAPWTPLFVVIIYLLHPAMGHVALLGAVLLFALGALSEYMSRKPLAEAGKAIALGTQFAEASARNAEVVRALGMLGSLQQIWRGKHEAGLMLQSHASDRAGLLAALAKFARFTLQVAVLGVGAWLVLKEEMTGGGMVAASILVGRALAPVEMAIGSWRNFLQARSAYGRLARALAGCAGQTDSMRLPAPQGRLDLESVYWHPAGREDHVIAGVSLQLEAGTSLGIVGPSGAGKSTLARLIVGTIAPSSGMVRLDNANIVDWSREDLGPHVGYLPQDIELFAGTVAQNICRFARLEPEKIVEAARLAAAHEMILGLPKGYDTVIGHGGAELSGGQRQRIGLARAVYGAPALIVLDEPTSNLDADGEAAVRQALEKLKRLKRTVIVIAHRPTLIGGADKLLVLRHGVVASFGATSQILPQVTRKATAQQEIAPAA